MQNRKRNNSVREGFTLVEVMLVLFIIMTLAAVGMVAVRNARNNSRIDLTKVQLSELAQSLERYEFRAGAFPSTAEGLEALALSVDGYDKEVKWDTPPLDPWKNNYNYQFPGSRGMDNFDLWSSGPDGQSGTEDDIWYDPNNR
ncbi:MAG: type II secretion system protein GspG [Planctomycetaceae bacterium]|nr:type II secretion system protein GspG [Planctomycetaceae bacterium]